MAAAARRAPALGQDAHGQPCDDSTPEGVKQALAALALEWAHVYELDWYGGLYLARNLRTHAVLGGETPGELTAALERDWGER